MQNRLPKRWHILVLGGGLEIALALLATLLGWWLYHPPWEAMQWDAGDALAGGVAALPMFLALVLGTRWPVGPMRRIVEVNEEFVRPLFERCTVLELGLLSATAGVGEEWLFRGFLQAACSEWLGPLLGWAIANGVFGLLHAVTPGYAAFALLAGLYFAALWALTGNLLTPMVAHAVYDWMALVYLTRRGRERVWGPLL
jgi:membrane protease YdiL (CAAX protease family)